MGRRQRIGFMAGAGKLLAALTKRHPELCFRVIWDRGEDCPVFYAAPAAVVGAGLVLEAREIWAFRVRDLQWAPAEFRYRALIAAAGADLSKYAKLVRDKAAAAAEEVTVDERYTIKTKPGSSVQRPSDSLYDGQRVAGLREDDGITGPTGGDDLPD